MTSEQMAWALVGSMAGGLGLFIWREITRKDGIEAQIKINREFHEAEIKEARQDATNNFNIVTGQFRSSIDAVNSTLGSLAQAIGRLDATMAKEYASKDDMKALKGDLQFDIAGVKTDLMHHAENCPFKGR